jgi:hypothetical protein
MSYRASQAIGMVPAQEAWRNQQKYSRCPEHSVTAAR